MIKQSVSRWLFVLLLFFVAGGLRAQREPKIEIAVESAVVFRGEPFLFQIKVSADSEPEAPVFPSSADFQVEVMAPSRNTSTQVQIINGRMTREEHNEIQYNYLLTPLRLGVLRIPSLRVLVAGKAFSTRPTELRCQEPDKIADVGLELLPSATECYVGEPVMLTWNWYVGRRIGDYRMVLPVLDMSEFWFPEYMPAIDPQRQQDYLRLDIGQGKTLIARQCPGRWQGQQVTKVSFSQPMIPKSAGAFVLPASSVVFAIEDTRGGRQRRSPFDDFMSSARMRRVSVEAAAMPLLVKELPTTGRPANFSGIVGACQVSVGAEPLDVSVGDPIIVTMRVSGPAYLDGVRLPDLTAQESLMRDFKLSDESPGTIEGGEKVFQFTLRARQAELRAIPSIELPYFDSKAGVYAVASSAPIPLTVHAISTVTAMDVEGRAQTLAAPGGAELRAWSQGIAANVEGLAVLENHRVGVGQWRRSPWWLGLVVLMPLLYGALTLTLGLWRRHHADPAQAAARQAAGRCRRALRRIDAKSDQASDEILAALRGYFGAKLRLPAAALVFADVRPVLLAAGLSDDDLASLEKLFVACEAGRYAGWQTVSPAELQASARRLLPVLDKALTSRRRSR